MPKPWLSVEVWVRRAEMPMRLVSEASGVLITGPSGAGKSTFLRVLAGVEGSVRGTVTAFGQAWLTTTGSMPSWTRQVGWVPQDALLFPHLTVRENLAYAGRGVDPEVVAWLGLEALLDRAPGRLSGGERQRVALGRALFARPRVLLLDEPFAALDLPLRARLRDATAAWCQARDVRVVLVSHDARDGEGLATEHWRCVDGRLAPA